MATPITSAGSYGTGEYYIANNITVAGGTALTFTGPARLNLAGMRIKSTNGGIGIQGSAANNIVVEGGNGSWIDGFDIGVNSSTPWTRIEGVIFDNIRNIGANLTGHTSRFIANTVNAIGGHATEAYAVGVNISGDTSEVRNNKFFNTYRQVLPPPSTVGEGCPVILNAAAQGCLVEMNFIRNDTLQPNTIGVYCGIDGQHQVRFNQILNFDVGVEGGGAPSGMFVHDNVIWNRMAGTPGAAVSGNYGLVNDNAFGGYPVQIVGTIPNSNNAAF